MSGRCAGALEGAQALCLGQGRSESKNGRYVDHLDVSIAVWRHADRQLAALIGHLGADLERRALHLTLVDVTRLGQTVACETAQD